MIRTTMMLTLLAAIAAAPSAEKAKPQGPVMKPVQTLKVPPKEGARNAALTNVRVHGRFVYARAGSRLLWWKRGEDGRLTEAGKLDQTEDGVAHRSLLFVGDRLYTLRLQGTGRRPRKVHLLWHDLDANTGKPSEAGRVEAPPTSNSVSYEPLIASPDGKSIYFLAMPGRGISQLAHFTLDAAGKATPGKAVTGKGIGKSAKPIGDSTMAISPDGRHIYTISAADHAVAVVTCGADGSPAYTKAVDLTPLEPRPGKGNAWNQTFAWPALAMSPDGKYLYVDLWSYHAKDRNCVGLYRREAETGDLELVGKLDWPGGLKGMRLAFTADGKGGCFGSLTGPVTQFARDPATGKLSQVTRFAKTSGPERRGPCLYDMTLDRATGTAYFTDLYGALFVFKMPGG